MLLSQDLCHTSGEHTAHRISMIVRAFSLVPHKHSAAVANFKKRLGVSPACHLCSTIKHLSTINAVRCCGFK